MLKKIALGLGFSAFMDMDKLIGADFEKGLASLDSATATRRQ